MANASTTKSKAKPKTNTKADVVKKAAGEQPSEFTFEHDGKTYTLPPAMKGMQDVKAGSFIDSILAEDDVTELRFGLKMLIASGPSEESWNAIRDMDLETFGATIHAWMNANGTELGK